jgi:hypothetical protein
LRYLVPIVVLGGAVPLTGWVAASAWLATMIVLLLSEARLAGKAATVRLGGRTMVQFLLSTGYALAGFRLLQIPNTIGEIFATTLIGVAMFAVLVRDYKDTRRLVLNLAPMIAVVALAQVETVVAMVAKGAPELIATALGTPCWSR